MTGSGGPRRATVTGAAGFIGSHLTRHLAGDLGTEVVGIDNERSGRWSRVGVPVERVHADLGQLSFDDMRTAMEGSDVLFHLAAEKYNSSKTTPEKVLETNVVATNRLFEAAAAAGVRRIVFTSSLYAYGGIGPDDMTESEPLAPTTLYGASKSMGEELLRVCERDHGMSWSVARLFFIYGPDQYAEGGYKSVIISNFERMLRGEPPTIYGDGEQSLDYVYIDDCVDALMTLAEGDGPIGPVNVATARGWTINQLTDLMLEVAASDLKPVTRPADWTEGTRRVGTNDAIGRAVGWTPRTDMRDGLERVWKWMRNEYEST